jgi:hypothetical protein
MHVLMSRVMTEVSKAAVGGGEGVEPLDVWVERWTSFDDFIAVMNRIIFSF